MTRSTATRAALAMLALLVGALMWATPAAAHRSPDAPNPTSTSQRSSDHHKHHSKKHHGHHEHPSPSPQQSTSKTPKPSKSPTKPEKEPEKTPTPHPTASPHPSSSPHATPTVATPSQPSATPTVAVAAGVPSPAVTGAALLPAISTGPVLRTAPPDLGAIQLPPTQGQQPTSAPAPPSGTSHANHPEQVAASLNQPGREPALTTDAALLLGTMMAVFGLGVMGIVLVAGHRRARSR